MAKEGELIERASNDLANGPAATPSFVGKALCRAVSRVKYLAALLKARDLASILLFRDTDRATNTQDAAFTFFPIFIFLKILPLSSYSDA